MISKIDAATAEGVEALKRALARHRECGRKLVEATETNNRHGIEHWKGMVRRADVDLARARAELDDLLRND